MRIHRLTLRNFRGVADRTVTFAERGVTVVEGPNESGKTSLTDALDLLLDYRDDSTAGVVKSVKPVDADVGAEVEAELSAGPYRFTYAKRFHRERSTTLIIHEPRREQLTGRPAHDRVRALLDETVDVALWRALRLQQGVELDQADLSAGTSLAAALDTAAGAGLGGGRETTVYERVRAEYERYHTPTGRPNTTVKAVHEAYDAALVETDRLSGEMDALDADVERVAVVEAELADLRSRLGEAEQHAGELSAAWQAIERRAGEVEQLRLAAELAGAERTRAEEDVARRAALVEESEHALAALTELTGERDDLEPALSEAEKARADAHAAVADLRADVAAARRVVSHHGAALDAARDREQLFALRTRLQRVDIAQRELTQADAVLETARVDDAALLAIEDAHHDALVARAALEAQSPVLRVEAHRSLTVSDADGDRSLADGETIERAVTSTDALRLDDVATVSVSAGARGEERAQRLEEATTALQVLLDGCGVADLAGARAAQQRRGEALAQRERASRTLSEALGEDTTASLAARVERLEQRIAEAGDLDDIDALRVALAEATAAAEARETAMLEAERLAWNAADLHDRRLATARLLEARITDARGRVESAQEALAEVRAQRPDAALRAHAAEASAAHEAAQMAYGQALRELEADDPEGTRAAAADAALVVDQLARRRRGAEDELRDVRSRLDVRGEQGLHDRFAEAMRTLEQARREQHALDARAASARLLYERMTAHRDEARRAYAAPFREKVERLGRIVFGERLFVELDDDLRIARRTLDGITLDFAQLSTGAREQLSVLARLACAAIVGRDGGVPLILDDALGYADPARLERIGAALRVGARECQVIVLTCVPERYQAVTDANVIRLGRS